jgi:hypothetical protein
MFTNLEQKLRRTAIVGVLGLFAVLTMGCQESKRVEIETGRNTLEARQTIERERLATQKQMQTERIEAAAARQREFIEAQKARDAERRRNCWLEGRRYCY